MSTSGAPASSSFAPSPLAQSLRRLYLVRFVFAVAWAALLWPVATTTGPLLTTLLVVYPLFDAGAVLWQLRTDDGSRGSLASQRINVAVSILVAVALGWASTVSIAAALVVWGGWAVGAGIPQLLTAIRNRRTGGQVPQMLSGGISVPAGLSFLAMGLRDADSIAMVGGYATVGGVFFLISAIRLSVLLRKPTA
jgi:uncharacterized membrane protein HdeD (DUF308 family)